MITAPRLSIFLPSLYGGGAERVMVTLANEFAARGLDVDLVVARTGGKYGAYLGEIAPGVTLVDLQAPRLIAVLPALLRYLRRRRPHTLLAAINMANVLAVIAKTLSGVKMRLVLSERNTIAGPARTGDWRDRLLPLLMRLTYRHADALIAISHGVACDVEAFTNLPRDKLHIIHNPLDLEKLTELSRASIEFTPPLPAPLIVAVGRLEPQKDYPTLLRAFALLRRTVPATMLILGEGRLRPSLAAQIDRDGLSASILMPGFLPNPFPIMRRADLVVLSSAWEGFGNVLVEAMACGTPVVSTDCPSGPAEILEHGKWGRLAPVGDAEALAEVMAASLADPAPPDVKQRAAQFTLAAAADRYLSVLLPAHISR